MSELEQGQGAVQEVPEDDPPPFYKQNLTQMEIRSSPIPEKQPPNYSPPSRYRKTANRLGQDASREERRTRARETRRTRRTVKLQQQKETHARIDTSSSSSEGSSIDENYDVASIQGHDEEEHLTWRGRMQEVLHDNYLHVFIIVLVALDAFIVIFELLLDVGAFNNRRCTGENLFDRARFCHYENASVCAPHAKMVLDSVNISSSPGNGAQGLCNCGFLRGVFVCLEENVSSGVNPGLVLHILSLIILSVFMVEIGVKMIAFRLKYFTHKFEVFDGIIVVISWSLDVASIVQEEAFEAAALLIVLRLWRVVRIINGVLLSSQTQAEKKFDKAKKVAKSVIHAFHKAQDKMDEFEEENINLKKQLAKQKLSEKPIVNSYKLSSSSEESSTGL